MTKIYLNKQNYLLCRLWKFTLSNVSVHLIFTEIEKLSNLEFSESLLIYTWNFLKFLSSHIGYCFIYLQKEIYQTYIIFFKHNKIIIYFVAKFYCFEYFITPMEVYFYCIQPNFSINKISEISN